MTEKCILRFLVYFLHHVEQEADSYHSIDNTFKNLRKENYVVTYSPNCPCNQLYRHLIHGVPQGYILGPMAFKYEGIVHAKIKIQT